MVEDAEKKRKERKRHKTFCISGRHIQLSCKLWVSLSAHFRISEQASVNSTENAFVVLQVARSIKCCWWVPFILDWTIKSFLIFQHPSTNWNGRHRCQQAQSGARFSHQLNAMSVRGSRNSFPIPSCHHAVSHVMCSTNSNDDEERHKMWMSSRRIDVNLWMERNGRDGKDVGMKNERKKWRKIKPSSRVGRQRRSWSRSKVMRERHNEERWSSNGGNNKSRFMSWTAAPCDVRLAMEIKKKWRHKFPLLIYVETRYKTLETCSNSHAKIEEEIHFMCVNCAHHTVEIQCKVVERRIVVIAAES